MASNRYNYTWADALLAIDTTQEEKRKREEHDLMMETKADEEKYTGIGKIVLGGLGALALGPMGWTIGTNVAEHAVDQYYDWEEQGKNLEIGKFNQADAISRRKDVERLASDQTAGQVVDLGKDLMWTYLAAGGKEGLEAARGSDEKFWRTFGSTKDDPGGWTLGETFAEGEGIGKIYDTAKKLQGIRSMTNLGETALGLEENILKTDDQDTGGFTDEETCTAAGFTWDHENQVCTMPVLEDQV